MASAQRMTKLILLPALLGFSCQAGGVRLTVSDAAIIAQNVAPVIRSRELGHCPVVHVLWSTMDEASFQVREACEGRGGSGLLANLAVRLDTGRVTDTGLGTVYDSPLLQRVLDAVRDARTTSMLNPEQGACLARSAPEAELFKNNCLAAVSRLSDDGRQIEITLTPHCNARSPLATLFRFAVDRVAGMLSDPFGNIIDSEVLARARVSMLEANREPYSSRTDARSLIDHSPLREGVTRTGPLTIQANTDLDAADAYWFDVQAAPGAVRSVLVNVLTGSIPDARTSSVIDSQELEDYRKALRRTLESRRLAARSYVGAFCAQPSKSAP